MLALCCSRTPVMGWLARSWPRLATAFIKHLIEPPKTPSLPASCTQELVASLAARFPHRAAAAKSTNPSP